MTAQRGARGPEKAKTSASTPPTTKTPRIGAQKRSAAPRRKLAAPKQTEAGFMATVIDLAKRFGWRHYHTHNSKRSPAGFPDLVLVRRPRVIFAELKTERGVLSEHQKLWLDDLQGCPVWSGVWRPSDLEYIVGLLRP